ncbi:hypothetical protein, partial [Pseudescherichia sp.]
SRWEGEHFGEGCRGKASQPAETLRSENV